VTVFIVVKQAHLH